MPPAPANFRPPPTIHHPLFPQLPFLQLCRARIAAYPKTSPYGCFVHLPRFVHLHALISPVSFVHTKRQTSLSNYVHPKSSLLGSQRDAGDASQPLKEPLHRPPRDCSRELSCATSNNRSIAPRSSCGHDSSPTPSQYVQRRRSSLPAPGQQQHSCCTYTATNRLARLRLSAPLLLDVRQTAKQSRGPVIHSQSLFGDSGKASQYERVGMLGAEDAPPVLTSINPPRPQSSIGIRHSKN